MQSLFALGYGPWLEPVLVLTAGTAVIVGLAALAGRWVGSAVWQRTLWQVAALGLVALLVVELTGIGPAVVRIAGARIEASVASETAEEVVGHVSNVPEWQSFSDWETQSGESWHVENVPDRGIKSGQSWHVENVPHVLRPDRSSEFPSPRAEVEWATLAAFDPDWPAEPAASPPAEEPSVAEPSEPPGAAAVLPPEPVRAWWPGVIWALGAAVCLGWITWTRSLLLLFRRRHSAVRDEALCRRVRRLARRLGIRRPVSLLQSAGLKTPVAFGTLRPTVVLPATFADEFGSQEQEAMLAHELAHLAARDPAWQLLADLLSAVLWWHPLAWWLRRRLRAASEAAADEASLLLPDGPHVLAACLVAVGRRITRPRRLGWLSVEGSGFRSSLGHRVERLLSLPRRARRIPGRTASVVAKIALPIALIAVTVLSTAWVRPRAALQEGGTTMSVLQTSWRGSLAALALVAFLGPAADDAMADGPGDEEVVAAAADREGEHRDEAEHREREEREEGEHREGDAERREGERREGDAERRERPDQPRERREGEGERREGERREGERREDVPREARIEQLMQHRRALQERGGEIERRMAGLRDGQDEEARELQRAMQEVRQQMERVEMALRELQPERERPRERREGEGERREGERREEAPREGRMEQLMQYRRALQERAEEIERRMVGLRDDQDEEARDLQRAMQEVRQQMERVEMALRELQPERERPREPGEEMERRIRHLRVAIENLHAAGLHDAAEHLQREAENMMRAFREGRPRDPDRPEHPEHREPPHPEQLEHVIREMHGQMERMQRQMDQMRDQIHHLLEREHADRD